MHNTTLWENIKRRVKYLQEHGMLAGEGAEIAWVLTEEIEKIYERLEKLEKELTK